VTAPLQKFALGSEVGAPSGVSLTATSGLPAADLTSTLTLTHPISGTQATRTVSVWRRRRWTSQLDLTPGSGVTYLFDECEFSNPSGFFCVDGSGATTTANQMAPSYVFRRCSFDGGSNGNTDKSYLGGHAWFLGCDLRGSVDGIAGDGSYLVIQDTNVEGYSGSDAGLHSDGLQVSETGNVTIYHSWISNGDGAGESSSIFFKAESATPMSNFQIYYTGIWEGAWGLQLSTTNANISSVDVRGCRWQVNPTWFGPVTFDGGVSGVTWIDNAFTTGTPIAQP
jgi:hypothetical protein